MKVMTDSTETDSTETDSTGIAWKESGEYADIRYETSDDGIAKITICRPEVHNAFRPQTIIEISAALTVRREDPAVGVIILTGEGDRRSAPAATSGCAATPATDRRACRRPVPRHRPSRADAPLPKPIIAMVAG